MDKKTKPGKLDAVSKDKSQIENQSKVVDADHKDTPQVQKKPRQKKPRMEKEIRIEVIKAIAAVICAGLAFLAGWLPLTAKVDDRDEKIKALNAEIAERDAQIKSLTDDINNSKNPLQEILAQKGKVQFEWQWAGENWYGRMVMEKQGGKDVITQAQVGLLEKNLIDATFINGQVLNLVPGTGSINITDDGVVHLEFTAKKKDRRFGTEHTVTATGDLQQALCYAGKVNYRYTDTGIQYPGDMILVNYITPLGDLIDYWFSPNVDQPWFERYIVDR